MTEKVVLGVEAEVRRALENLCIPRPQFSFLRASFGDGNPHIEVIDDRIFWVSSERGAELFRILVDEDELFFLAMEIQTRRMAQDEELRTRTHFPATGARRFLGLGPKPKFRDDYSRATWIEAHVRLMGAVRPYWAERIASKYREVLRRYPLTPEEHKHTRRLSLTMFGLD